MRRISNKTVNICTLYQNRPEDAYLEPHNYRIYYVNIDWRHQYGISVAKSHTFLRAKRSQRRRARRNGCFRRLVFLLSCILPIKVKRGGRCYTFTANLNAFYLKLLCMEKIKLNDSHFFMTDWFTYPSVLCFCRWCFIFLLLLIKYEQWNIWSCKSTRKWPRTQKISRVETNYSPGIGEAKFSLGLHN